MPAMGASTTGTSISKLPICSGGSCMAFFDGTGWSSPWSPVPRCRAANEGPGPAVGVLVGAVVITDLVSQIHQRNTQFWPEPVEKLQPQDSRDRTHLEYLSDLKCFYVMQIKLGFLNIGNFLYYR